MVIDNSSDKTVNVDSKTSVYFPQGCVETNTNVSITEVPTPLSQGRIEEKEGRLPIRTFYVTSDSPSFDKPVTFRFPIDNLKIVLEHKTTLYLGCLGDDGTWELVPVVIDEATKTGTAQVTHFSVWELIADVKIEWGQEAWSDWEELITGPCGEAVNVEYSKSYDIRLMLSSLGVTLSGNMSGTVSGSSTCSAIPGYQRVGYGRSKVAVFNLYTKWPLTTEWTLYGVFEFPKYPVQMRCGSVRCHEGGSGS